MQYVFIREERERERIASRLLALKSTILRKRKRRSKLIFGSVPMKALPTRVRRFLIDSTSDIQRRSEPLKPRASSSSSYEVCLAQKQNNNSKSRIKE